MEYGRLYQKGKEILEEAGVPEAKLDARLLLEYATGAERNTLYAHPERMVEAEKAAEYEAYLAKRAERIPLAYITGWQSFMGLDFSVNENVLIPRQDTEILVEEVLKEPFDGSRILDICTGSGCILLSLLHYSNDCTGIGTDLSKGAIEVARKNAGLLSLKEHALFLESDLAERAEDKFDIIVSNPPYIKTNVINELMPEVRDHEPFMALDGKDNGLYFYEEILKQTERLCRIGTRMYFEIGYDQGESVKSLMQQAGFSQVRVVQDYGGLDRVAAGIFAGEKKHV
ncbi:MAG: peptide chain release factor N(5)-glutamine methyltransferase [Lachnospiraceae bacterium]|nr:peptide chain release factor N(5)-glutamine methyltransferase [Lachnospiraceae bacterium]